METSEQKQKEQDFKNLFKTLLTSGEIKIVPRTDSDYYGKESRRIDIEIDGEVVSSIEETIVPFRENTNIGSW